MKLMHIGLLALLFTIIGCSMPQSDAAVSKMEQYWKYYKVENYDSLKSFYIPKGDNPEKRLNDLFSALHNLHNNYGNVHNVSLIEKSASKSLDKGDRIELIYEVEYEKKVIHNQFSFAKDKNGEFKILDQSFDQ